MRGLLIIVGVAVVVLIVVMIVKKKDRIRDNRAVNVPLNNLTANVATQTVGK